MKSKIPFALVKFVSVIVLFLPFLGVWLFYYESRTSTVGSRQVSVLVFVFFLVFCYYFCHKLDAFRVSVLQIRDVAFGLIIAILFTDLIIYFLIWMLSIHMPNILPGVGCVVIQCFLSIALAFVMHRAYFASHKPLRTAVIYDERMGMENLIQAYGLEKRFYIEQTYIAEAIIDNLISLKDMDALFLCGVHSTERNRILKFCTNHGIKLFMIPRISDVMMRGAEQIHMLHLPILKHQRCKPLIGYRFTKRAIDIVFSGIALAVASPVMLVAAIAIKKDGGPAFYKQRRLTKDGKVFEIIKFRSMRVDAEKYSGAVLSAGENDPRITPIGRKIRAWRIDELPQLINILKGDMSIVGPRPERPELQEQIKKDVPEYDLRLQVKAGLTGYAQVYGKYNTTFYDKLLMDLMYISRPSILEDLTLMLATAKILGSKDSTEGVGEDTLSLILRSNEEN